MEQTENLFDIWLNNTNKMMDGWKTMAQQWNGETSSLNGGFDFSKAQQQWMDNYQAMFQGMSSPFGSSFNAFNNNTTRDAFFNMLKSTDIYTRLFQLWQPVFQQMQSGPFNVQDAWKLINPEHFRSFVDTLFGIDTNAMNKGFMDQYMQLMNMWTNSMGSANKSFGQMFGNGMPFFGSMSQMNPQSMAAWYSELMRSYQKSFSPFFGQTTNGTMPPIEPLSGIVELWGTYMSKVSQMQSLLYKTSIAAWEKVMESTANKAKDGQTHDNFQEFYNEWSTINEQEYTALFNTEEFAALQGEVLKLQSEIAKTYEKQMEAVLQPYPIVLRSQLEEVYKTNHDLRQRIDELERMVAELNDTLKASKEQGSNQ